MKFHSKFSAQRIKKEGGKRRGERSGLKLVNNDGRSDISFIKRRAKSITKGFSYLRLTGFLLEHLENQGSPQEGDARQVLPLAPIGSIKL